MKAYLVIEVKHSAKKDTDYISCSLVLGKGTYFINLTYEAISVLLDMKISEVQALPSGYRSKEFNIEL